MGEHRDQDARAADLDRREAAIAVRDELSEEILAAAAERDDEADQRDDVASERDRAADLTAFLAADGRSMGTRPRPVAMPPWTACTRRMIGPRPRAIGTH